MGVHIGGYARCLSPSDEALPEVRIGCRAVEQAG
jgi:hypothetical protein